jgi:hypothetical protein
VPARRFIGGAGAARTVSPEAQLDVKAIASPPLASSNLDYHGAAFLPPRVGEEDQSADDLPPRLRRGPLSGIVRAVHEASGAARRRTLGTIRPRVLNGPSDHILPAMQSETALAVVVPI